MTPELEKDQAERSRQVWQIAALGALFFVCCLTRLLDLGWKAIMHDEALFVYYTEFQLYKGWDYNYLPILHGPAMLQVQALIFHLFGSTTYTMRLGCALLGIAGFFWIHRLKPWLGTAGMWVALIFYTLSPGITYYQRFFRNDALYLFTSLWIVTSFAWWWRSRKPAWIASALLGCVVLFTNKESSLFLYFSLFSFFIILVLHDLVSWIFRGSDKDTIESAQRIPRVPNPFWPTLVIGLFLVLAITQIFEGLTYIQENGKDDSVVRAIGHDWILKDVRSIPLVFGWTEGLEDGGIQTAKFWRLFYGSLFTGLFILFGILGYLIRKRIGAREFLGSFWVRVYTARFHIAGALGLGLLIYLWVFTTGFKYPTGVFEIYRKTWSYWGGQHEWGRIGGPFHQHMLNMLVYELPSVLIVGGTWLFGLFCMRPSRSLSFALFLIIIAFAGFHQLIFQYSDGAGNPINVPYLKNMILALAVVGGTTIAAPAAARILLPASFAGLLIYSISFLNSAAWKEVLRERLYKNGEPVELANRHVDLNQFMEIQFNFDGGTSLAIVLVLIFFATIYAWWELEQGRRFRAFLIWWTVTATGAASYAREAVPQVGIHAMLPLILLSASYIGPALERMRGGRRAFLIAGIAVLALWNLKATTMLNFYYADDPRERMVYGPSPQDLAQHCQFVLDYHDIASIQVDPGGTALWYTRNNDPAKWKDVHVGVSSDPTVWAVRWYLRNVDWRESKNPQEFVDQNYEFMFITEGDLRKTPQIGERYHTFVGSAIRFWQPARFTPSGILNIWKEWIPGHYLDGSPQAGEAYRAKQEWRKLRRYVLLRETFDGGREGSGNVSGTQYVFCVRKDLY